LEERGFWRGDGEEEFVVLAVGEGRLKIGSFAAWDGLLVDFKSASAGSGEAGQVGAESVANIHHGGGVDIFREPLAFLETGGEIEVVACDGAAELSCDEEQIARFSARAGENVLGVDVPRKHDRDGYAVLLAGHFAAGDGDAKAAGGAPKSTIEFYPIGRIEVGGRKEGYEGLVRRASHGGDIAQRTAERLPTHFCRIMRTEKMNILCDAICFEQNECAGLSTLDGGTVVTWAEWLILRNGNEAQELVEQFVLGAEFHFMRSGHWSVP
jgi:hypothetical protein